MEGEERRGERGEAERRGERDPAKTNAFPDMKAQHPETQPRFVLLRWVKAKAKALSFTRLSVISGGLTG